ncbi:ABC transporter permease [Siphonobacter aquaeclarae]|uniref:ABC-type antimicrobial peptide transport system, permease component n=1 Tax=Siphonobacter aquaeclarae TaxID=563176 RepID=A0A1G9LHJ4_9BACT|nr:ABC transporter permease [Siphonobacter aquaeclarae]SDL61317.1 ABC-type antimicrobial peptide transport system, permease component [Siphonobacter aquaeclarae]
MLRNYLKVALRALLKNKAYSFINIVGLATGMAVTMLIGLWIWDELTFDRYHKNYDRIAQVMLHQTWDGHKGTQTAVPVPLHKELKAKYSDFKYVVPSSWNFEHILSYKDKKFRKRGSYMGPDAPDMLSLNMLKGTGKGLLDPHSILLSESVAKALFGDEDPINKVIRTDNKTEVKVTGVYEDLPANSELAELSHIMPWNLYVIVESWVKNSETEWHNNSFQTFAMLQPQADFDQVSAKIKNVVLNHDPKDQAKPEVFLHPMAKWHLYSEFKEGVITGGRVEFVWLFGIIGGFVLLLACINFMNLSTARSEKRAREVGVRKAIGSLRQQLISQFLSESILVTLFAFVLSIFLVEACLPWFNELSAKKLTLPWQNPVFWIIGLSFTLFTGFLAGSYPAFYLSSFEPVKVLKGTFRVGRYASLPRKVLVVLQFTVSVTLIIGTIAVFRQIQFAKERPIGYTRDGLVQIDMNTEEISKNYEAFKTELLGSGVVASVAKSSGPITDLWSNQVGFDWKGKDPNKQALFGVVAVSADFGKTMGLQFVQGRDFSASFATDSAGLVVNEAAAAYIGKKNLVGETIKWNGKDYTVLGIIKNVVMNSPYKPVDPTILTFRPGWSNVITMRIEPSVSTSRALAKIEEIYKKHDPGAPFEYKFSSEEYGRKFASEERVGKLATFFAILAIFISCLGLFGLASFVAEQRIKEIGVRKVLGASVFNLWGLLSKDFVMLVLVSLLFSIPIAWYAMSRWLERYEYHSSLNWWIFAAAGAGALAITLATVSYQAISAAMMNPVKSLKTE